MATLKELRLEAGYSYAELSRRANVSEPTVKRALKWETRSKK